MLGKDCVDDYDIPVGTAGRDVEAYIFRKLRKDNLWPIHEHIASMSEDDVFDLIEFLYDHVSIGIQGHEHTHAGCGWHYTTFDAVRGK